MREGSGGSKCGPTGQRPVARVGLGQLLTSGGSKCAGGI